MAPYRSVLDSKDLYSKGEACILSSAFTPPHTCSPLVPLLGGSICILYSGFWILDS